MKVIALIFVIACLGFVISTEGAEEEINHTILAPFLNGPTEELFKVYHLVFKKDYEIDSVEGLRRKEAFHSNMQFIKAENQKGHSYKLGVGPFTDMTNEEYKKRIMNSYPAKTNLRAFREERVTPEVYQSFTNHQTVERKEDQVYDYDHTTKLGPVRNVLNQYSLCAAEGTVATLDSVSFVYKHFFNKDYVFSPQQNIDCNPKFSCGSRSERDASDPIVYYGKNGFALESDYPYLAKKKAACTVDSTKLVKVTGFSLYTGTSNYVDMLRFKDSLTMVGIDATRPSFQHYTSGVYSDFNIEDFEYCGKTFPMLMVAYNEDSRIGKLRNSWGVSWGEQGYMRANLPDPDIAPVCVRCLFTTIYKK